MKAVLKKSTRYCFFDQWGVKQAAIAYPAGHVFQNIVDAEKCGSLITMTFANGFKLRNLNISDFTIHSSEE